MYTRCIDSNLESGRYISRVGRATSSSFLSLGTVVPYRRYLRYRRYNLDRMAKESGAFSFA